MLSSPLTNTGHVRIAFNVLELPERAWLGGRRQGLSSGWFDREGERGVQVRQREKHLLLSSLSLSDILLLFVYLLVNKQTTYKCKTLNTSHTL